MASRATVVYHPGFLAYDFGPQHPLRPERISAGLDLLQTSGLWDANEATLEPSAADAHELGLLHAAEYVRAVQDAGFGTLPRSELARYGLAAGDNPAFPGMHEPSALLAGGAIVATRKIMSGQLDHAFHPSGGLHHAMRARASGFCIYNDPALAAAVAVREFGARVLYVDLDCHHGDGVQWLFYDDPTVLTLSFHESGRYLFPGTGDVDETGTAEGRGYAVNVPFLPFTDDDSWLTAIRTLVPTLAERFKPDLIISSHGADTHHWDPLTHLSLTTRSFEEQTRMIHDLAHEHAGGRWLAVGSGGYDWRRVVPRAWAIVWSVMTERPLPERLPADWVGRWGPETEGMPSVFRDQPGLVPRTPRDVEIRETNDATLQSALRAAGLHAGVGTQE
jgi:acetoin utilization protein AcuC